MKKSIIIENAAKPIGPYSHAVEANGVIYVSGQGPVDPSSGIIPDSFECQVKQTFANLHTILEGCGVGFDNVAKVNVYLSDLALFEEFNEIYKTYFTGNYPARTTIGAKLLGIMLEIDCIAIK